MSDFKCPYFKNGECLKITKGIDIETEYCSKCCIGCKHAVEMDCFNVCSMVAGYYYPIEDE